MRHAPARGLLKASSPESGIVSGPHADRTQMPSCGYLCTKYNRILVHGGRANDLPGVGYTAIRGVYDFSPMVGKIKRRSVYGVSRPSGFSKHVRRSLRR